MSPADASSPGDKLTFTTEKHLKCDYVSSICKRCQRAGERCIRSKAGIKFRHGSSARFDTKGFSPNQTWLKTGKAFAELKYIDETADLVAFYDQEIDFPTDDDDLEAEPEPELEVEAHVEVEVPSTPVISPAQVETTSLASVQNSAASHVAGKAVGIAEAFEGTGNHPNAQIGLDVWSAPSVSRSGADSTSQRGYGSYLASQESQEISQPYHSSEPGTINKPVTTTSGSFLPGLVKRPSRLSHQTSASKLEVVLLRYFVDVLACWFDLCDPEKHFELIVPHRARWCPPLKNAILCAAARHLTRVHKPTDGLYHYQGRPIPGLRQESALHYHSECIKELLKRSLDPEQTRDENLLAAAIILRFYEEIDAPLRDEDRDSELFLRVMNVFIDAQLPLVPLVPHSSPMITGPKVGAAEIARYTSIPSPEVLHSPGVSDIASSSQILTGGTDPPTRWRTDGLCQSGFWVAFRQEIYSAFLKQRPFNLALSRCEAFRSFSPAEDAVWADRLIIFCADVLEFCYGNNVSTRHDSSITAKDHWQSLKEYERTWAAVLPASFEPIYFRDPDRSRGEVFPEICYLADCHVAGVQHVELAKILLAVYDPTRPKLGPGYVARMNALSHDLRMSVLRLCGIAVSNRKTPPGLITALLGIVMCGDHFDDPLEQDALWSVLDMLEYEHAWPVGDGTRNMLKQAWGRESIGSG